MVVLSSLIDEHDILSLWIQSKSGIEYCMSESTKTKNRNRKRKHKTRCRLMRTVKDYTKTKWGLHYHNPLTSDPNHSWGKLFRLRFRVPLVIFNVMVKQCEEKKLLEDGN